MFTHTMFYNIITTVRSCFYPPDPVYYLLWKCRAPPTVHTGISEMTLTSIITMYAPYALPFSLSLSLSLLVVHVCTQSFHLILDGNNEHGDGFSLKLTIMAYLQYTFHLPPVDTNLRLFLHSFISPSVATIAVSLWTLWIWTGERN